MKYRLIKREVIGETGAVVDSMFIVQYRFLDWFKFSWYTAHIDIANELPDSRGLYIKTLPAVMVNQYFAEMALEVVRNKYSKVYRGRRITKLLIEKNNSAEIGYAYRVDATLQYKPTLLEAKSEIDLLKKRTIRDLVVV
jgi:hypothetical protein